MIALTLAAATLVGPAPLMANPHAERPNIVFILADDLGWADLGCYGSTFYKTPNLDRLAKRGMRFTDAYAASSVCSPTRASIMSGKYPARLDLTLWLTGSSGRKRKLLDAPHAKHLPLEDTTIAEALKEFGYTTAAVGKWHLGPKAYYPEKQGFDLNVAGTHYGWPPGGYFLPNRMELPGAKKGDYLTDRLTDEGLNFIEKNKDRLFFLYQSYHSVHTPIQGKPELVERYRARVKADSPQKNATYAAMVHSLDENVGRIMAKLDELRLSKRTVVIFFSDNGGYLGATSNVPLRKGKGYSYEGGHREPLIVSYPGHVPASSVCHVPVISTDFYPTILDLAGLPSKPKQHLDGVSFAPLLRDPAAKLDREAIYWHYPHYSPQGGTPSGAIRLGDYKLIEFFEDGHVELYDLAKDLSEKNDLSRTMPQKTRELHEKLRAWRKDMDAKMPPVNPGYKKK
jgi:arylsulfatase A